MFNVFLVGIVISAAIGLGAGWVRYWMGFFVLFQGVIASLGIAWLVGKYVKRSATGVNPSNRLALLMALIWLVVFWAGQVFGLGLAQPWFDPLGYFGRILQGDARETAFGLMSTAGWARSFHGGFGGVFWVILNLIDAAIMYLFLFRMPWPSPAPEASEDATSDNPAGGES
jgi:hypothetical protein